MNPLIETAEQQIRSGRITVPLFAKLTAALRDAEETSERRRLLIADLLNQIARRQNKVG